MLTKEWARSHQVTISIFDGARLDYDYGGSVFDLGLPGSDGVVNKIYNLCARSFRLQRLIRLERPDRIVSFLEAANVAACIAAALAGRLDRLAVSVRNNPDHFPLFNRILIPWLYRLPKGVVAVSFGVKQALESRGLPANKISVIGNPAEATDLHGAEAKSARPLPGRYILGIGRLERQKGFDRLLRAFHMVDDPGIHLAILGEGSERPNLLQRAREYGVDNRLRLPGRVVDVQPWYQHAECLVLSSRYEGWPNVIVEALAHGCPVVSFDCKYGPAEIISHGETGLLVPEGDIGALAASTSRILCDETLRRALSTKGLNRSKAFRVRDIAPRWLR